MNTYIVDTTESSWTEGKIFGLGDALDDARILDRTLADWRGAVDDAPSEVEGPAFVVARDLWYSPGLPSALKALAAEGQLVRLARTPDGPGAFCDPLSRLPREEGRILFDCWFVPSGMKVSVAAFKSEEVEAKRVELSGRTHTINTPMDPELLGRDSIDIVVGPDACVPVSHWVELLRANLIAIGTQVLAASLFSAGLQLMWAAFRAMSLNPFKILQKLTTRGRKCTIHPSAVVEGCTLGDNVQIDAHAVLRGCHIGNNVQIGAHTIADFSVFGEGSRLTRKGGANLSVVYPGASVGGDLQLAFVGEKVTTKLYSVGTDMVLGGPVQVKSPRGRLSVDIGYQGVCLGHRAFLGSGIWIAPGRVIGPERRVLRAAELMVLK